MTGKLSVDWQRVTIELTVRQALVLGLLRPADRPTGREFNI